MIRGRIAYSVLLLIFLAAARPAVAADAKDGDWIQLFNGKDLDGWIPKIVGHKAGDNYANTFRVENGTLKVVYDPEHYKTFEGRFGHLFYKQPFSHYRIRVEYRFVGDQVPGGPDWAFRNNGIMIHGESPLSMDLDQPFPTSIECQLLGGRGTGMRPTANVCTPGTKIVFGGKLSTSHCMDSTAKTYHGDQWVTVEVEAHGNRLVKHIIDGKTVLSYEKPQLNERDPHAKKLAEKAGSILLDGGTISLQSESHPTEFRKVELRKLEE